MADVMAVSSFGEDLELLDFEGRFDDPEDGDEWEEGSGDWEEEEEEEDDDWEEDDDEDWEEEEDDDDWEEGDDWEEEDDA